MEATAYALRTTVETSYEETIQHVKDALKAEGFGVLTEIDVKATLKQKLDVDFRKYVILGACNPPYAHRALQAEREVGLLLPCNVIVYEADKGGTVVAAIDPVVGMQMIDNPTLAQIAAEVRVKLDRAVEAVSKGR